MLTILGLLKNGSPNDTVNVRRLIRDTFTEFLATTLFVFNGTLAATSTGRWLVGAGSQEDVARVLPIAMSFGISIMTLAYSMGHISGGHMNPGVSLLMFFRRQMSFTKMVLYWFAQMIGAMLGASITWGCISGLTGDTITKATLGRPPFGLGSTTLDGQITTGNGFLLELMGSFFFYFVIAQTALDTKGIASSFFPALPIGFSLVVVHICLIPFTGCGVNPARTFGPSAVVCMSGADCATVMGSWYWIYYVAPAIAAFAVSEVTLIMDLPVEDDEHAQTINEAANTPEVQTLEMLTSLETECNSPLKKSEVSPPELQEQPV